MIARKIDVRVLLVSGDNQTVATLGPLMEREGMQVETCSHIASAIDQLGNRKFEAVVLDFKERAGALELLKESRKMTSNKAAVVIAILNVHEEMPSAFRAGARFVLVRPLTGLVLIQTLRASYPLMVREKRRSFRCPLQIPTHISTGSRSELVTTSANISESGMAITNAPALQIGERVVLRLTLPGASTAAKITAEVRWRDESGRAGMEFVLVSHQVKEQLMSWLNDRLAEPSFRETVRNG